MASILNDRLSDRLIYPWLIDLSIGVKNSTLKRILENIPHFVTSVARCVCPLHHVCVCVCVYVCAYVCVCVCVCVRKMDLRPISLAMNFRMLPG